MSNRLYLCCRKPDCSVAKRIVWFVKMWGLDPTPELDGQRSYFDVSVPKHWGEKRRDSFAKGLKQLPVEH